MAACEICKLRPKDLLNFFRNASQNLILQVPADQLYVTGRSLNVVGFICIYQQSHEAG